MNLGFWLSFQFSSQLTERLKIGIPECCPRFTSQFFPIDERDWKLGFSSISLDSFSNFFPIHEQLGNWDFWSSLAFIFSQTVRILFQAGSMWSVGKSQLDINYVTVLWQFKGYHCYKAITSQNVSSETQVDNFYFVERLYSFSRYSSFVFLTFPWFTKFVTSWWVLAHEKGRMYPFEPQVIE